MAIFNASTVPQMPLRRDSAPRPRRVGRAQQRNLVIRARCKKAYKTAGDLRAALCIRVCCASFRDVARLRNHTGFTPAAAVAMLAQC